ncbi:MAG: DNA-processing protein DprA [Treponema sp.]|nr:DNA-processing protein DprA [Treponema sp.]
MLLTDQNFQDDNVILKLFLARMTFLTVQEKKKFANNIDSLSKLALCSIEDICNETGRKINKRIPWDGKENLRLAKAAAYKCKLLECELIYIDDPEYPELLRQISDPPFLLFCRGNYKLLKERAVSVVGTRRITPAGRTATKQFAYDAAMDGCNVVSGLAVGVDGNAHQGAVDAFFDTDEKGGNTDELGRTIAVMPSAIDQILPSGQTRLASQILQTGGCLVSEYEPGEEMANWHYVGRNRIIAGLSPATVVIEAPAGSGALITADFALDYNRDVFFHEAAFGKMAEEVAQVVEDDLEKRFAAGQVSKYKIENRPEKFLKDGAGVIKNYKDYCKALTEMPGQRSSNIVQQKLFEE